MSTQAPARWGLGDFLGVLLGGYVFVALVTPLALAATNVPAGARPKDWPLSATALTNLALDGTWILASLAIVRWRGRGPVEDLRLATRPIDVPLGLACGAIAQLVGNLLYLPFYWWGSLDLDQVEKPARELADKVQGTGGTVLFVLVIAVLAPVAEEILFRGLLLRGLERRLGTGWAVGLSALVFAGSHFEPLQLPALFLFGLVAALLAVRTGRLGPSIAAHIAFNGVATYFLLT